MSKASYNKKVITPFVNQLLSEKKFNERIRKKVERQQGQVLIYSSVSVIEQTFREIGIDPSNYKTEIRQAWAAGREKAKELHTAYTTGTGADRFKALQKKWKDIKFKTKPTPRLFNGTAGNTFLVSNFRSSLVAVKKAVISKFTETSSKRPIAVLTEAQAAEFSQKYQRGHGEEGLAVSQVQIAEILSQVENAQELIEDFEGYIQGLNFDDRSEQKRYIDLLQEIKSTYTSLVDENGNLRIDYFSIVRFQPSGDNAADQRFEKGLINYFKEFAKTLKIAEIETSPSLFKKLKGLYIYAIDKNIKPSKNLKIKSNKSLPKPGTRASGTVRKSLKQDFDDSVIVTSIPTKKSNLRKKPRKKVVTESAINLNALKAQINAKLPAIVRKNMLPPGLVNRTGRFAASAQVDNIIATEKGFPSIGYTYMKFPYQTFEPGFAKGDFDRDPRRVIDKSVREIANELLTGRFYTRSL